MIPKDIMAKQHILSAPAGIDTNGVPEIRVLGHERSELREESSRAKRRAPCLTSFRQGLLPPFIG